MVPDKEIEAIAAQIRLLWEVIGDTPRAQFTLAGLAEMIAAIIADVNEDKRDTPWPEYFDVEGFLDSCGAPPTAGVQL